MDASMKDIKTVVTKIHEFEYWDNSLLKALFGNFGQSKFRCKGRSEQFFKWSSLYECKAFEWDLDERNRNYSYVEN